MSGGLICDMGPHYFDLAQWAHRQRDERPRTFEGTAVWPPKDMFAQVPYDFHVVAEYDDGVKLILQRRRQGHPLRGRRRLDPHQRRRRAPRQTQSILAERKIDEQSWTFMRGHIRNFLDCVRSARAHRLLSGAGRAKPRPLPLCQHLPPPGPEGRVGCEVRAIRRRRRGQPDANRPCGRRGRFGKKDAAAKARASVGN